MWFESGQVILAQQLTIYLIYIKMSNDIFFFSPGEKKNPFDIAQSIASVVTSELATNPSLAKVIDKIEVAKPGFVNVFLSRVYAGEQIKDIIVNGVQPPTLNKKLRVLVDFSSPNIAKEMHVGHLR
jgi:Arginyl-tRNA synthetase